VSERDILTKLALTLSNGVTAVYIFFVLSGCVLRRSLDNHAEGPGAALSLRFVAARILRLYPPTIACMVLFYGVSHLGIAGYPVFNLTQLADNASLWAISMHGPSETIQAEVLAVPFILVVYLLRRWFGVVAAVLALVYGIIAIETSWMVFGSTSMRIYLFAIIAGMIAAEPKLKPLISQISGRACWWCTVAAVVSRMFVSFNAISGLIAMVVAITMLVAGLLHGNRGSLAALLERPTLQALGRISFSFYLLNVPVLDLIWSYTNAELWAKTHALEAGLLVGVASIALTWPLAWASERWIERPSIAAGRWVWKAFRAPDMSAGQPVSLPG